MTHSTGRRYLALALPPAVVLLAVYVALIRPRLIDVGTTAERIAVLEGRVDEMRAAVAGVVPDELGAADVLREIERRIPAADPVPALLEELVRPMLAGGEDVRNLRIETGDPVTVAGAGQEDADPRFGLLSSPVRHTPITVSFDGSYPRIGRFLWELRTLPTLVEIGSLRVQSAMDAPLAHVDLELRAYARAEVAADASPEVPPTGARGPAPVDVTNPPEWIRNPLARVEAVVSEAPPDPVVGSILFSRQRRVALVDGRIVTVGDEVGIGRVVDIERDAVIVETAEGGRRRLELGRSARQGP